MMDEQENALLSLRLIKLLSSSLESDEVVLAFTKETFLVEAVVKVLSDPPSPACVHPSLAILADLGCTPDTLRVSGARGRRIPGLVGGLLASPEHHASAADLAAVLADSESSNVKANEQFLSGMVQGLSLHASEGGCGDSSSEACSSLCNVRPNLAKTFSAHSLLSLRSPFASLSAAHRPSSPSAPCRPPPPLPPSCRPK
jgi:hypothetical protein